MAEQKSDAAWKWTGRVADIWGLIPPWIRDWLPSAGGGVVAWLLNQFGIPLWQALVIGVCVVIFAAVPLLLGRQRRASLPESLSQGSSRSLLTEAGEVVSRLSALRVSWIVPLALVLLFSYSLYMQSQLREIHKILSCYVLPRHLTSEQKAAIVAHLKKYRSSEITVLYPGTDNEAVQYATEFQQTFGQGDWSVRGEVMSSFRAGSFPDLGLSLRYTSNRNTRREYDSGRQRDPHPGDVAARALEGLLNTYNGVEEDPTLADGVHKVELIIRPRSDSVCK